MESIHWSGGGTMGRTWRSTERAAQTLARTRVYTSLVLMGFTIPSTLFSSLPLEPLSSFRFCDSQAKSSKIGNLYLPGNYHDFRNKTKPVEYDPLNWAETQNRVKSEYQGGWLSEVQRDFKVCSLSLVYLKIMFMLTISPSTLCYRYNLVTV